MNDDPRRRAVLDVTPTSALLPPNGRVPIEVTFCPREEKFHNFNLAFNVRKKLTKLSINVKGEGFKVGARPGSRVSNRNSSQCRKSVLERSYPPSPTTLANKSRHAEDFGLTTTPCTIRVCL